MKYLNVALLLMMSFTLPANHPAERTPAAEVRRSPVDEILKNALELRQRGDFEGALVLLKEAKEAQPTNADVGFYLGLTFYNLGKFDDAEKELRSVLAAYPLYVDVKIILGRVLIAQGKLVESEKLLRESVAQSPDYMDAYDALASNLLAQKKNEEAIFILDLGIARKPDEATLLVKKAKIYFVMKNYAKAHEVARTLTGVTDIYGRYQGHILLAKIAFEENPMVIEGAVPDLEEAIDLEPSETEAYLVLADVYTSMWKFKKANELLTAALDEVKDRARIEQKIADIGSIEKGVLNFSVNASFAQWNFKDGRAPWTEFYLDAVWRIDPYKTLVFGYEKFTRGGVNDETVRVEYIEKVNKWVYIYASAKVTADPDFREKSSFKLGTNFVTNPLGVGSTVFVAEAETRNYDTGKIYFLTGGVDQYLGDSLIINARVFRVLTDSQDFTVWSTKATWSLTPKFDVSASYGTMTEDVNGRLVRGTSAGVGAQYRINDRVAVTGNYTRVNNELYRANQVSVGLKVSLGRSSSSPSRRTYDRDPAPRYEQPRYENREPAPRPRVVGKPPVARPAEEVKEPAPKPVKKKKRFFFF